MPPYYLLIPILGIMSGTIVTVTAMILVSRHIMLRRQPRALPNDDVIRRLERIEQIVDTTAVEVERLAESNRFVAKLLAERSEAGRSESHS